jgi:hypothetical protein
MNIRIMKRPAGEAPESIRDAWIGLTLPVLPDYCHVVEVCEYGIRSDLLSRLTVELKALVGGGARERGYVVDPTAAVDLLKKVNPLAAAWWLVNVPHVFKEGRSFLFNEECCMMEPAGSFDT